ncbi:hypothetical protein [Chitinophaga sp. Cy-1792]|uniref:hypothetical protein n=1 Tax=Chitinophaga sp. Cy-1792 TaxID=2608339 RepID=UPI00142245AA|nr:hypothetical protein [Chitinophaga sp. Cy-1792]NIG55099.1 hypothetical protein [Chitinophaga sp. Cy-1792]
MVHTLQQMMEQLEQAVHPMAKALYKSPGTKVLALAFKKGMRLKDHKAHEPTTLYVLSGSVVYEQGDEKKSLAQYEQTVIPVEITHAVFATEDSLCLLVQGEEAP